MITAEDNHPANCVGLQGAEHNSNGAQGDGALLTTQLPSPTPFELRDQLENLREFLHVAHRRVAAELAVIIEDKTRFGLGTSDQEALLTGLCRLTTQARDLEQGLLNLQLRINLASKL
jgi:hypothetical protein